MKILPGILVMCLFIAGCSKKEPSSTLSASELATALNVECWKIQLPDKIKDGDNLVLYFIDHEGNEIKSACNFTIRPNEITPVNIAIIPLKGQPFGDVVGYEIAMFNSSGSTRTIIHNPLNKTEFNRSSRENRQKYKVGDILMVYGGEQSSVFTRGKVREFQAGLTTKIKNYN